MKESNYKTYEELPLFLNAETVANVLGIAMSSAYELMKDPDFPALRHTCIDEVMNLNGSITLDDAVKWQE